MDETQIYEELISVLNELRHCSVDILEWDKEKEVWVPKRNKN